MFCETPVPYRDLTDSSVSRQYPTEISQTVLYHPKTLQRFHKEFCNSPSTLQKYQYPTEPAFENMATAVVLTPFPFPRLLCVFYCNPSPRPPPLLFPVRPSVVLLLICSCTPITPPSRCLLFSTEWSSQEVREGRVAELAKVAHADKIRQTKSTENIFR